MLTGFTKPLWLLLDFHIPRLGGTEHHSLRRYLSFHICPCLPAGQWLLSNCACLHHRVCLHHRDSPNCPVCSCAFDGILNDFILIQKSLRQPWPEIQIILHPSKLQDELWAFKTLIIIWSSYTSQGNTVPCIYNATVCFTSLRIVPKIIKLWSFSWGDFEVVVNADCQTWANPDKCFKTLGKLGIRMRL